VRGFGKKYLVSKLAAVLKIDGNVKREEPPREPLARRTPV
jgi:hypothetical protein